MPWEGMPREAIVGTRLPGPPSDCDVLGLRMLPLPSVNREHIRSNDFEGHSLIFQNILSFVEETSLTMFSVVQR